MLAENAAAQNKRRSLRWFLIEQDGAVLVVRQKEGATSLAEQWTLPGDFAHGGESAGEAIARFAQEELGIAILGQEFLEALPVRHGYESYEVSVYRVGFEGRLRYRSGGPFAEVGWATKTALPEPMPVPLRAFLQRLLNSGGYDAPSDR